jgi:hypothetical protein
MKSTLKSLVILFVTLILTTSGIPTKKNQIYGTWKIITGKHNGTVAPKVLMNRTISFTSENTFQSLIITPEGKEVIGNFGIFYLINDTTMVTYHKDQAGKPDNVANTYNFKIQNDSMHFHGYYLGQTPANQSVLNKIHIDEWWVRSVKK